MRTNASLRVFFDLIRKNAFLLLLSFQFIMPSTAYADCTLPDGKEGHQVYNSSFHIMQFCNGTNWISMGADMGSVWQQSGTVTYYSAGKVGIKTNNPVADFHVIGTGAFSESLTISAFHLAGLVANDANGLLSSINSIPTSYFPAMTGEVISAAGSFETAIALGVIEAENLKDGAVDLSTAKVVGTLAAGRFPALTGDVTTTAGSLATTIASDAVALGADTTGDYVVGVTAGAGISVTGTAGEAWSPTITNTGDTTPDTIGDNGSITLDATGSEVTGILPIVNGGTGLSAQMGLGNLANVNVTGAVNTNVLKFDGANWVAGLAASAMSQLTDVTLTSPANNDMLLFNGTNWINKPATANKTQSMVAGWPDAIICMRSGTSPIVMYAEHMPYSGDNTYYYRPPYSSTSPYYSILFNADKTWKADEGLVLTDCHKSITQLYAEGKAFDLVGGDGTYAINKMKDAIITNPQIGQYLKYTGEKWENVMPLPVDNETRSMIAGWPDAIVCIRNDNGGPVVLYAEHMPWISGVNNLYHYRPPMSSNSSSFTVIFNGNGSWNSDEGLAFTNCHKTIAQLYANKQAFDLVGGGSDTFSNLVDVAVTNPAANNILSFNGATSKWVNLAAVPIESGGTNNSTAYTAGSVIFSNGTSLIQDNANIFWNDTTNRLGIGTVTPASALHVMAGDLTVSGPTGSLDGNNIKFVSSSATNWNIDNYDGYFRIFSDIAGTGTERFRIDSSGNVGIGNIAPAYTLDVSGRLRVLSSTDSGGLFSVTSASTNVTSAVGAPLVLINRSPTAGNYGGIVFIDANSNLQGSIGMKYGSHTANGQGSFYIEPKITTTPSSFVVDSSGNVGIGTAAPTTKFDVSGNVIIRGSGTIANNLNSGELQIGYAFGPPNTSGSVTRLALQPYGHTGGPWKFVARDVGAKAYLDWVYGAGTTGITQDAATGDVGIGNNAPSYKLHIAGTAYATGAAGALSDIRHKKNIKDLSFNALSIVENLHPVSYQWKEPKDNGMKGQQMGFIAQDVQKILPDAVIVEDNEEKTLGLKYNEFIPILTKAIKELAANDDAKDKKIEDLERQIQELRAIVKGQGN